TVDFVPKVKVEVLAEDDEIAGLVDAIAAAASTGKIGDGKLWVTDVALVQRIRTGEGGGDAAESIRSVALTGGVRRTPAPPVRPLRAGRRGDRSAVPGVASRRWSSPR